jgi:hypothetical protein
VLDCPEHQDAPARPHAVIELIGLKGDDAVTRALSEVGVEVGADTML